jgi:hypothetical protein
MLRWGKVKYTKGKGLTASDVLSPCDVVTLQKCQYPDLGAVRPWEFLCRGASA